jgi:putative ABC transport system permease protein
VDARDATSLTLANIRSHKLRSALAAIGVTLGIAAVIGIVTVGAGFQQAVIGLINDQVDSTAILVGVQSPGLGPNDAAAAANLGTRAFTDRDVAAFGALPDVKNASATQALAGAEVYVGGRLVPAIAVTSTTGVRHATLESGRQAASDAEATVSNATALVLAKLTNATVLGSTISVHAGDANETLVIVGIAKSVPFGPAATPGIDVGASLAPTVMVDGQPTHTWATVSLHARDAQSVPAAVREVKDYAEQGSDARHRLGDGQSFLYSTQEDIAKLITSRVSQFTAFLGAIGGIALLVGLVGIANIMLVSVTERTREIGVMKALGASSREVLALFLLDAIAICVVGALLGICLGSAAGLGLDKLIGSVTGASVVPFVFVANWYAIAIGASVAIGIVAGLYPAWRAARVSPVEALRYE